MSFLRYFLLLFVFSFFLYSQSGFSQEAVNSQETNSEDNQDQSKSKDTKVIPKDAENRVLNMEKFPSLFFTYWQHEAINDAKNSRGVSRPPTAEELAAIERGDEEALKPKPKPEEREIVVGGIVYVRDGEWTIWMNGKRITPDAVPKEVLDLRVFKDYIEMKWLDEYTNQIFPIRMRAHQRFNMDMRIFLPG